MNNQNNVSQSGWGGIFAAIASIGTIFAAITPIVASLTSQASLAAIFIDTRFTVVLSVIALLGVTLSAAFFASNLGFNAVNFANRGKITLKFLLSAFIGLLLFLVVRQMFDAHVLNRPLSSILQAMLYLTGFISLGCGLGIFLRDIHDNQKFQHDKKAKLDKIRNLLLESGRLDIDFKVTSIVQDQEWRNNVNGYFGAHVVNFESKGKKWVAAFDNELCQIIGFEEYKEENTNTTQ